MSTSKSLRVLVDLTRLRADGKGGGIKPALLGLLSWCSREAGNTLSFFYIASADLVEEVSSFARCMDRIIEPKNLGIGAAAQLECDLVYCPFGITDWACPGIPTVTLIVDLLHRDFPESLSVVEQRIREDYFQKAAERTDVFQVISEANGSDVFTGARSFLSNRETPQQHTIFLLSG